MEDSQIIALFEAHDERAVAESEAKYGYACTQIALSILENTQEAEVCAGDAIRQAYDALTTPHPEHLGLWLVKATRALALERYKAQQGAKRGNCLFLLALDELDECIPAGSTGFGSGFDDEHEARTIGASMNRFLKKQPREARDLFICRYFYADTIGDICRDFGLGEKKVRARLRRIRLKLKKHLEREGVRL